MVLRGPRLRFGEDLLGDELVHTPQPTARLVEDATAQLQHEASVKLLVGTIDMTNHEDQRFALGSLVYANNLCR